MHFDGMLILLYFIEMLPHTVSRSGSGQRYFDKKYFCDYCNRTGHPTHRCFKLKNYLKKQGKRIVLHDDDDVQEIAQAVHDLNTKLNSLKLSNSTNN